jgi:integrase
MNDLKRRGRGEGTISELPNGTFWARVSITLPSGKRKRVAVYGKTKTAVQDKLLDLRADIAKGKLIESRKVKLSEYLETWLEQVITPNRAPLTLESYRGRVDREIVPYIGNLVLRKITPMAIQKWLTELAQKKKLDKDKKVVGTVCTEHARRVLRSALSTAVKWDMIASNPVSRTETPRYEHKQRVALTAEQAVKFLKEARKHRWGALFVAAMATGARKSELLGLRWEHVDFASNTISFAAQIQRVKPKGADKSQRVQRPLKTEKSRRTVSMPEFLKSMLEDHRAAQMLLQMGKTYANPLGYVFTTSVGTTIDQRNATAALDKVLNNAELPRIPFHSLRHSCASLLLAQGVDIKVISQILGHSTIQITADIYLHPDKGLMRDAASKLDSLLHGQTQ